MERQSFHNPFHDSFLDNMVTIALTAHLKKKGTSQIDVRQWKCVSFYYWLGTEIRRGSMDNMESCVVVYVRSVYASV